MKDDHKRLKCLSLAAALEEKLQDSRQYCTPGHRAGKAYKLYAASVRRQFTEGWERNHDRK